MQNDLQRTIEGLYMGIKQRKLHLYRQSGETNIKAIVYSRDSERPDISLDTA